jgi:hypothetical protein
MTKKKQFTEAAVREIRRALVRDHLVTPKSGKARSVVISPFLGSLLQGLIGLRRRQSLEKGWPDIPEFVFCSETGAS